MYTFTLRTWGAEIRSTGLNSELETRQGCVDCLNEGRERRAHCMLDCGLPYTIYNPSLTLYPVPFAHK